MAFERLSLVAFGVRHIPFRSRRSNATTTSADGTLGLTAFLGDMHSEDKDLTNAVTPRSQEAAGNMEIEGKESSSMF